MAKPKQQYTCQECGETFVKWSGQCRSCKSWNTLIEETISDDTTKRKGSKLSPHSLTSINEEGDVDRMKTGMNDVDQVLGGGIVPGSTILLAGEPGIGKSTILLQLSEGLSRSQNVLYISGEESLEQVKLRAKRLGVESKNLSLLNSTNVDDIAETIRDSEYGFVIVDSIQTMQTSYSQSSAGTVSQITNSAQVLNNIAKATQTALLMVGHVTKQGNIAGPKILEHLVDVVLNLEGERYGGFKALRTVKNRFGATNEMGLFEMKHNGLQSIDNPSEALLSEKQDSDGSIVFPVLEGTRVLLVEVQALVNTSPFGYPKRTASGIDLNRLNLLIAVLSQRAGIKLGSKDVYVNIVGGMKVSEPAVDLAVCLAIASAAKKKKIKANHVVFGEVGLGGEVRSVHAIDKRLKEAKKLGFDTAITAKQKSQPDMTVGVSVVSQAIKKSLDN